MQIKCPSCAKSLQVNEGLAGKKVKCPCGSILSVPGAAAAGATGAAGAAAAGGAAATRPPAKAAAPRAVAATAAPSAQGGFDQREVSSLFDELTPSDMVVKKATTVKKSKKDPLAAHMTAEQKAHEVRKKETRGGAAKEVFSSIGILAFLGVFRFGFSIYLLMNVDETAASITSDPTFEGDVASFVKILKIIYYIEMTIGGIFLACAALIFQFPLTCAIVAMVTYIISEIIGFILNPLQLVNIRGWIIKAAIFGGLVQTINNAAYYKFVKAGGRDSS